MLPDFETIESCRAGPISALQLGRSREGRPILGYRLGRGALKVSLIAGCHADEPVGPRLLEHVVSYLATVDASDALLTRYQWWVVPHVNPDGAARNAAWTHGAADAFDLSAYLRHVVREPPGDDVEFGFPRGEADRGARPENRALYEWWRTDPAPFALHASLHGMAFAGGPWFLIDRAWMSRCDILKTRCRNAAAGLGYRLHDVERYGEKGFTRIERGFCTRPDSEAMARFFVDRGDAATAKAFRPSSMETIRSLGGDALTLVSEVPLFITPDVGETITPADPVAERWRARVDDWRTRVADDPDGVAAEVDASDARTVPVSDQVRLQWEMIRGGLAQVVSTL
jgi:hypothetical protein